MDLKRLFRDWKDVQEYVADERVFSEQDSADALFLLLSGEVQLALSDEAIGIARQGSIFGETALLGTGPRGSTATAISNIRVARIEPEQLRELMRRESDFAVYIMAELANRLRIVNSYITARVVPGN